MQHNPTKLVRSMALALRDGPLSVPDLVSRLVALGLAPQSRDPEGYLRPELSRSPYFRPVIGQRGLWELVPERAGELQEADPALEAARQVVEEMTDPLVSAAE